MTKTKSENGSLLCQCNDPHPGAGDHGGKCKKCGNLIGGAIIGGEVHPGYTTLGNGQAFFDAKESVNLEGRNDYNLSKIWSDEPAYVRTFGSIEVVVPHHTDKARNLGTEWVSVDHAVTGDGDVTCIVQNRAVEDLPDGPKWEPE